MHLPYEILFYQGEEMMFKYWDSDQPDSQNEKCVNMRGRSGWKWHDYRCNGVVRFKYPFICQFGKILKMLTPSLYAYYEETYFVKEHSGSKNKYYEADIIKMMEFLVDNIFVVFAGKLFQQTFGIPNGTNCAPLLADIFLFSFEADLISYNLCSQWERNRKYIGSISLTGTSMRYCP